MLYPYVSCRPQLKLEYCYHLTKSSHIVTVTGSLHFLVLLCSGPLIQVDPCTTDFRLQLWASTSNNPFQSCFIFWLQKCYESQPHRHLSTTFTNLEHNCPLLSIGPPNGGRIAVSRLAVFLHQHIWTSQLLALWVHERVWWKGLASHLSVMTGSLLYIKLTEGILQSSARPHPVIASPFPIHNLSTPQFRRWSHL